MLYVKKQNLLNSILFLATIVVLIFPAIINGYPLLHVDSPVYITAGQIGDVRVDASYAYAFFLRHISLSWTLWLPIIVQSLIVSYVIFIVLRLFVAPKKIFLIHFILIFLLGSFTGLSVYCSLLMPDIFTAVLVLSLIALIFIPLARKVHLFLLAILFGFSAIVSFHNIRFAIVLICLYLLIQLFYKIKIAGLVRRFLYIGGILCAGLFFLAIIYSSQDAGFRIPMATSVIFSSQFTDFGLTEDYLALKCDSSPAAIPTGYCEKIDQLHQLSRWEYLYSPMSPLYENCEGLTWQECWLSKEDSMKILNKAILSVSELKWDFYAKLISRTLKQFFSYTLTDFQSVSVISEINEFYEVDSYACTNSTQSSETLTYERIRILEIIITFISFLLATLIICNGERKIDTGAKMLLCMVLSALLINAFLSALLFEVDSMHQGRIIFILPLTVGLIGLNRFKHSPSSKKIDLEQVI